MDNSYAQVQRGRYLAAAGDCEDCHTAAGGKPYAGGRAIPTPFGTIYSPNITPDQATGLGGWTRDQFYRAMHEGLSAHGAHLYPAFPYTNFTRATREDVDDIWAYLQTLDPVRSRHPPNELPWPLSMRWVMSVWNTLFFDEGTFKPTPGKSAEWNRGAYLVEGLGHCGACHTQKNFLGADEGGSFLQGGGVQDWFASNLGGDHRDGLGAWSKDDIVEYLATGRNRHAGAGGPMGEVIQYSTSKMTHDDLAAIATYLKDLPSQPENAGSDSTWDQIVGFFEGHRSASDNEDGGAKPDDKVMAAGEAIYVDQCAACHKADGTGVPGMFPPLRGNANVQARSPTTVAHAILYGVRTEPTNARPTPFAMPAYGWKLKNPEVAAVATYVRNAWGNHAAPVTRDQVHDVRTGIVASE
ncbi:MAG TPA: cytochrome c [Hyphomicrobiales bacterium]|nr:cytochrome c [Hyphomicrobiales bacterium]